MDLKTKFIKELVKGLLHISVEYKEFALLKELYDYLNLYDNKKIMVMYEKNPKVLKNPRDGIFEDIIYIIKEEVCHNEGLLDKIIQYYLKKYPVVKESFERNRNDFDKYKKELSGLIKDNKEDKIVFVMLYFVVNDETDSAITSDILTGLEDKNYYGIHVYKTYTQDLGIYWGIDNLDKDKLYMKYLKKQRNVLTDYLGIEPDELESYLLNACTVSTKKEYKCINRKLYFVEESLFKIMDRYTIPADCIISFQKIDYHKIIKDNFESLCGAMVYFKYREYLSEDKKLEHSMLMFHVEMENPEAFFQTLVASFYFELLTMQFKDMIGEYYKNFSFDKFLGTNQQQELLQQIEKLKAELEEKKDIIVRQSEQAFNNRQKEYAEAQKENSVYEKQISQLNRQIDNKDDTIKNLKRQLEIKDEYISLLLKEDDDTDNECSDLSLLQSKKYLFVGDAKEALPELKKTFPNSLFMETETFALKNIKADCIVMLVKYMSHGMYYKVKSVNALNDVPVVMCNTKNINTIYGKMMEGSLDQL